MRKELPREEIDLRLVKFILKMDLRHPDWETALIVGKVNQFYFTGTMQEALLVIRRGGERYFFVRRSLERARDESPLETIYPMQSFKDAVCVIGSDLGKAYVEEDLIKRF